MPPSEYAVPSLRRPRRFADTSGGVLSRGGLAWVRVAPEAGRAAGPLGVARRRATLSSDRAAVFVDRDGVINELVPDPLSGRPESPLRVADVRLVPGAAAALRGLVDAGWRLDRRLQPAQRRQGSDAAHRAARDPGTGPRAARRGGRAVRRLPPLSASSRGRRSRAVRAIATVASPRRGCWSPQRKSWASTSGDPGWSATPTETCKPGARPGAGRSSCSTPTARTSEPANFALTPSLKI